MSLLKDTALFLFVGVFLWSCAPDDTLEELGKREPAIEIDFQLPQALFTDISTVASGESSSIIMDRLIDLVDATPANGAIYLSVFGFDYLPLFDALLKADDRGVELHIMIDRSPEGIPENYGTLRKMESSLSDRSEVFPIVNDARSIAINHNKFVLFSHIKTEDNVIEKVVFQTSHNFMVSGTRKIQDAVILQNQGIYNAYLEYWGELKNRSDGGMRDFEYREYLDPGEGVFISFLPKRKNGEPFEGDIILDLLDGITRPDSTRVRIGMSLWTDTRLNIVDKLEELNNAGCIVEVVTKSRLGDQVREGLGELKEQGVLFHELTGTNIHSKIMLIDGFWEGQRAKVIITGSQNFTGNALYYNNEISLVLVNSELYAVYDSTFNLIKMLPE